MNVSSFPSLSIQVNEIDNLINFGPLTVSPIQQALSSIDMMKDLQKICQTDISTLLPTLNLANLVKPNYDSILQTLSCYEAYQRKPIEELPKTLDDFKNVFPNFAPLEPIDTNVDPNSLVAKRKLHEESDKPLTPLQKLLDQNFKAMHSTIQSALSAARAVRVNFEESLLRGPFHPYQKLICQYLGINFVSPSIHELIVPKNYCPKQTLAKLSNITDSCFKNTLTQFQHITAGIGKIENSDELELMQNAGHCFAVLSATAQGDKFVIDQQKTANYLAFAETVRTMPMEEILNNPIETAQRLLYRLIEILDDTDSKMASESSTISLPLTASAEQVNLQLIP